MLNQYYEADGTYSCRVIYIYRKQQKNIHKLNKKNISNHLTLVASTFEHVREVLQKATRFTIIIFRNSKEMDTKMYERTD